MEEYLPLTNFILFLFEVALVVITSFANLYTQTLSNKIYLINIINIILFFTELIVSNFAFDTLIIVILSLRSVNISLLLCVFYVHIKKDSDKEDEEVDNDIKNKEGLYDVYHALCVI